MAGSKLESQPTLGFKDRKAWVAWLKKNHAKSAGIWMRLPKKGIDVPSISKAEALEDAICFGWIDGQGKSDGPTAWLQRFCPRSKKSIWSKINRAKALELIAAGEMQPAGLAEVERAKQDGRWDAAYDSQKNADVPPDLEAALNRNTRARAFFDMLDSKNRYAILFRTHHAKKAGTRARRIEKFIQMLENGEKIYAT